MRARRHQSTRPRELRNTGTVPVIILACHVALLASCAHNGASAPARIHVPADTVTLNTTLVEPLNIHVTDAAGRTLADSALRLSGNNDAVALVGERGGVQCRSDGVVRITARAGTQSASTYVRCEMIRRIETDMVACVHEGDKPFPMHLAAYGTDGRVITRPRLMLINPDTNVALYRDGFVTPLHSGTTSIELTTGRRTATLMVVVRDSAGLPKHMFCD